ncbi:DUF1648 domain-containing protein [Streptomyces sp. RPA4-5]|uniref:DUF1648 domain-containing protein n=1 Tax=Streptomyces sp. RPA4-5 TaxID=2721245 RepID=UPI0032B4F6F0
MVFSSRLRLWLLPNFVLLAALTTWGIARYPHLPSRIPEHIGIAGVDSWTGRSIGSVFLPVFVYIGVTVLLTACAELTLRVTPLAGNAGIQRLYGYLILDRLRGAVALRT